MPWRRPRRRGRPKAGRPPWQSVLSRPAVPWVEDDYSESPSRVRRPQPPLGSDAFGSRQQRPTGVRSYRSPRWRCTCRLAKGHGLGSPTCVRSRSPGACRCSRPRAPALSARGNDFPARRGGAFPETAVVVGDEKAAIRREGWPALQREIDLHLKKPFAAHEVPYLDERETLFARADGDESPAVSGKAGEVISFFQLDLSRLSPSGQIPEEVWTSTASKNEMTSVWCERY